VQVVAETTDKDEDEDEEPEKPSPKNVLKLFGNGDEEHPLAEGLYVWGLITEEGVWVADRSRAAAEHLMGRKVDPA
jgi:hypothetical protein